jgi:hypothetical protein
MKLKMLASIMKYSEDDRCEGMRVKFTEAESKRKTDLFQKLFLYRTIQFV